MPIYDQIECARARCARQIKEDKRNFLKTWSVKNVLDVKLHVAQHAQVMCYQTFEFENILC